MRDGAVEPLWTPAELAKFLGYKESTVARMASEEPQKLPPRAPTSRPRWLPEVCREWAAGGPRRAPKRGRPRKVVP